MQARVSHIHGKKTGNRNLTVSSEFLMKNFNGL